MGNVLNDENFILNYLWSQFTLFFLCWFPITLVDQWALSLLPCHGVNTLHPICIHKPAQSPFASLSLIILPSLICYISVAVSLHVIPKSNYLLDQTLYFIRTFRTIWSMLKLTIDVPKSLFTKWLRLNILDCRLMQQ